jgi:hypothetical protein
VEELMAYPSTFADLQTAVLWKGKLDDQIDTQRIKDWINQAYYQACVETEFYETSATATALGPNQTTVTVPASLVGVDYIIPTGVAGDVWGPMVMVTFEEILEQRAYNAGVTYTTGAPTRYAYRSSGTPTIEVWPNPNGGETLTFYGFSLPTPLSAAGDIPIIPEPYATKVLEYGALVQAAEQKRDIFILDYFQQSYVDWMGRLRGLENTRVGNKTQQFRVDRQYVYPKGNSTDTPYNWN